MPDAQLLVVGSGPAGVSAAKAYRDAGGSSVVIVSADIDAPYERPPLSKNYLRGEAEEGEFALEPELLSSGGVDVLLGVRATALDRDGRAVTLADGRVLTYETCLLAIGSTPVRPTMDGGGLPGVHVLRSLSDARSLRSAAQGARSAIVVGSGFIGCEASSSLARRGLDVTMLTPERAPQEARLGHQMADRLAGWLRADGVALHPREKVSGISAEDGRLVVRAGAAPIAADIVVLATGVRPNVELAKSAGLTTKDGRIRVDAGMRTGDPHVYAAGDAALADNAAAGRPLAVEHWGDALTMGEIAGRNAAGEAARWGSAPGFWSVIGDRTIKYSAWGDGYDESRTIEHDDGAFTVWYSRGGRVVGALTYNADADYERGTHMVEEGAASPV